jgi:hypothetical protein
MRVDTDRITEAILATGCGPLAMEEGAALADHWISSEICSDKKIVAVECGFVLKLDELTYVIGVQDLLTDEGGIVGNEWKTSKEQTKYWNESRWFASIAAGSQVAIYALALKEGVYYERGRESYCPSVESPRIRVRAISKSTPPVIWAGDNDGILTFCHAELERTRAALLSKAASIRAMRKGPIPWQLPGIWCVNQFKRECEHYSECSVGKGPSQYGVFAQNDPAFSLALPHIGDAVHDPEVVILGASMYGTVSECAEKYRRATLGGDGEESMALSTGTVLHAAVSEYYRQVRENQLLTSSVVTK